MLPACFISNRMSVYYDFQNAYDPIYSTSLNWDTEFITLGLYSPTFGPRFPLATLPGAIMSEFVLGGFRFPDFQGDPNNRAFWFDTDLEGNFLCRLWTA